LRQIIRKLTSKKIYLIRHGQTNFNLNGIVQGSGIDSSLNETGMLQAMAFHEHFSAFPFDVVFTSRLKRSQESVASFISAGVPHHPLAELNEINWGTKEGTKITPEEDAYYHWLLTQWQLGNTTLRIEGGESPEDVAQRQRKAIQEILAGDYTNILICMHGRAIRIMLCQLLNYPLHAMDIFEHQNLGLYVLNYTGSIFSVERYNSTHHLLPIRSTTVQPLA